MTYLFFDTETTGFKNTRMTQLAFILVKLDNLNQPVIIKEFAEFIKPNGWEIPKEKFFIDNNMSTERCEKYGKPVNLVLSDFNLALSYADIKVAHNISFDNRVIIKELNLLSGWQSKVFSNMEQIDTMQSTRKWAGLTDKNGRPNKAPSLVELYNILFAEQFNAHDALDDVKAMIRCFVELKQKHGFYAE